MMQVTINIPDEIPQDIVNKMLSQFEKQMKTVTLGISLKEPQETTLLKRQSGLGQGTIWMSDDFDEPLPDSFWLGAE
jgi:hypothetical protein